MTITKLFFGALFMASGFVAGTSANAVESPSVLSHSVHSIDGEAVDLTKYEGKVLLIVNVASKCGYTTQYTGLQDLSEKYKEKGLVVMGFPCNQFGGQEPGSSKDIQEFCSSKYKVTFDMFDKVEVNGDKADPLYKDLTAVDAKPKGAGPVKWNFEKFVVNKKGKVVARFPSSVAPDSKELLAAIDAAMAE